MTTPERRRVQPVRILGLTLTPPWSSAILDGGKRIENRTWKPSYLRGDWMALHGGKVYGSPQSLIEYAINWYYICAINPRMRGICPPPDPTGTDADGNLTFDRRECVRLGLALKDQIPTGIFGVCKVRSTLHVPKSAILPGHIDPWYAHGQIGWKLTDVVLWRDTIPASGKQGLWEPDEETIARIKVNYRAQTDKEMV